MSKRKPLPNVDLTEKQIQEIISNEWMNLGDTTNIRVESPFDMKTRYDIENPHIHVLKLMRDPKYFSFTCKYLFNKTVPPIQLAVLRELWYRPFPMLIGSRGFGKTFLLALYAMLRATLCQGVRIVVVGAGFRQAKYIFDYCDEIWSHAPILRDICGDDRRNGPKRDIDRCQLRINESLITALPIGDGSKIRGQRGNVILADEFASIPIEVYENVISGFAAVSMSPIDKLQQASRVKAMKRLGVWNSDEGEIPTIAGLNSNQSVVSGTAHYGWNPFCDYWKRWKGIIHSKGDRKALEEIFRGEVPEKFDWRHYSIMRIPASMLPDGYMDVQTIAKSQATMHSGTFQMEYSAIFLSDSNGFYKRSLVESCVVGKPANPIFFPDCGTVTFHAVLRGVVNRRYVMAIDPASEKDNFSIVILEIWPSHRRIVHCWTTTRNRHKAKLKKGLVEQVDFYSYTARRIRDLLKLFPCERIALDMQGGGVAVMEALHDPDKLRDGETPIWPVIDSDDPKDSDAYPGEHMLEMIQFAKADWVREANHGMRKDFEDKTLLFPEFNSAVLGRSAEDDKLMGRTKDAEEGLEKLYDTLEDCFFEIEELKDELATIEYSQTGTTLRDRWDTPDVKLPGGKKGKLRKDRYSALLMANMVARTLQRAPKASDYAFTGGFAKDLIRQKMISANKPHHQNPAWYTEKVGIGDKFGAVVRH